MGNEINPSMIQRKNDMLCLISDALDAADKIPGSRQLALVKTKLQEAAMWGNHAPCLHSRAVNEVGCPTAQTALNGVGEVPPDSVELQLRTEALNHAMKPTVGSYRDHHQVTEAAAVYLEFLRTGKASDK